MQIIGPQTTHIATNHAHSLTNLPNSNSKACGDRRPQALRDTKLRPGTVYPEQVVDAIQRHQGDLLHVKLKSRLQLRDILRHTQMLTSTQVLDPLLQQNQQHYLVHFKLKAAVERRCLLAAPESTCLLKTRTPIRANICFCIARNTGQYQCARSEPVICVATEMICRWYSFTALFRAIAHRQPPQL